MEAALELRPENPEQLTKRMKEIWVFKKNSQPMGENSAGCTFKNPDGQSAGKLIDEAGLKGATVGGAMVSRRRLILLQLCWRCSRCVGRLNRRYPRGPV